MKVATFPKHSAIVFIVISLLLTGISFAAQTFYVNSQTGSDGRNGLAPEIPDPDDGVTGPKLTVTDAMRYAVDGDTISVANTGVHYPEPEVKVENKLIFKRTDADPGAPVFTNAVLTINQALELDEVKFLGAFQFDMGLSLQIGQLIGGQYLTIGNMVNRSNQSAVNGQLKYTGTLNFTYINNSGGAQTITTGDEFPTTAQTNVAQNLTTLKPGGGALTLAINEDKSIIGILNTVGPVELNFNTLNIVGAADHLVGGNVSHGTLVFDLTGDASIDGQVGVNAELGNVEAKGTANTLTINPGGSGTITNVANLTSSGNASITTNNTGTIADITNSGSGDIAANNNGTVGNVLATATCTGDITLNSASPHTCTSITQSGFGKIQYAVPNVTEVNVTNDVILNSAFIFNTSADFSWSGVIDFPDVPTNIGGKVVNQATFSGTTNRTNQNNGRIDFGATTNPVTISGLTQLVPVSDVSTIGGTTDMNGVIDFHNTSGTITSNGGISNGATWANASPSNHDNGTIATSGVHSGLLSTGTVANTSSCAGTNGNGDIDFQTRTGNIQGTNVSSNGGSGGDVIFGDGDMYFTGNVSNSRSAAGADIIFHNGAGIPGKTFMVDGDMENSGSSNIVIGLTTDSDATVKGTITNSGPGMVNVPNLVSGNFSAGGITVTNGVVDFPDMTTGLLNTGVLTVTGGEVRSLNRTTGDVTASGFTLNGSKVAFNGDGVNTDFFVNDGPMNLILGELDLTGIVNFDISSSSVTIGGTNTNPTFTGEAATDLKFVQPGTNILQTVTFGYQIPTWEGTLTVANNNNRVPVIEFNGGIFKVMANVTFNSKLNAIDLNGARIQLGDNNVPASGGNFINLTGYTSRNDGRVVMAGSQQQIVTPGPGALFGSIEVDNNYVHPVDPIANPAIDFVDGGNLPATFTNFFYLTEGMVEGGVGNIVFNKNTQPYPTIVRNEGEFSALPGFLSYVNIIYHGTDKVTGNEVPPVADKLWNMTVATTNGNVPGRAVVQIDVATTVNGTLDIYNNQGLDIKQVDLTIAGEQVLLHDNGVISNTGLGRLVLRRPTGTTITGGNDALLPTVIVGAGSENNQINGCAGLVKGYLGGDRVFGGNPEDPTRDGNLKFENVPGNASLSINFAQNTAGSPPVLLPHLTNINTHQPGQTLTLNNTLRALGDLKHKGGAIQVPSADHTLWVEGINPVMDGTATLSGDGRLLFTTNGDHIFDINTQDVTIDIGTFEIDINVPNNFFFVDYDVTFTGNVIVNGNLHLQENDLATARNIRTTGSLLELKGNSRMPGGGVLTLDPVTALEFRYNGRPQIANVTQLGDVNLTGGGTGLDIMDTYIHNGGELNFDSQDIVVHQRFTHSAGTYVGNGWLEYRGNEFNNNADFTVPKFKYNAPAQAVTGPGIMTVTSEFYLAQGSGIFTHDLPGPATGRTIKIGDGVTFTFEDGGFDQAPEFLGSIDLICQNANPENLPTSVWPSAPASLVNNFSVLGNKLTMPVGTRRVNAGLVHDTGGDGLWLPNTPRHIELVNTAPFNLVSGNVYVEGGSSIMLANNSWLTLTNGQIYGGGTLAYGYGQNVRVVAGTVTVTNVTSHDDANIWYAIDAPYPTNNEIPPIVNNLEFTRNTDVANSVTTLNSSVRINGELKIYNDVTTLAANVLAVAGDVTIAIEPPERGFTNATPPVCTFNAPLSFVGGDDQNLTVLGTGQTVGSITLSKDKPTNKVTLTGGDLIINQNGTLNFVNGLLVTGNQSVEIPGPRWWNVGNQGFNRAGVVGNNISHVVGNVRKHLPYWWDWDVNSIRAEFPVGTNEYYRPFTFIFPKAGAETEFPNNLDITVGHTGGYPQGNDCLPIADPSLPGGQINGYPNFYWQVHTNRDIGQYSYDLEMTGTGFTNYNQVSNLRGIRRHGTPTDINNCWVRVGTNYDNAEYGGPPPVPVVICQSASGGLRTGGAMFTYGLENSGLPLPQHFSPVWDGNPYRPMNIFVVKSEVAGQPLIAGDEIGVFDGDTCVGVGVLMGSTNQQNASLVVCSADEDPSDGIVDGFASGNPITFKLWDQSEDLEYFAGDTFLDLDTGNPIPDVPFTENGTASVELESDGLTPAWQCIPLSMGWNIFSLAVTPMPASVDNVKEIIDPILANTKKVMDESGASIEQLFGSWVDNIGLWQNTEGYYIKMLDDDTLCVYGQPIPTPLNIPFTPPWNIMSYPCYQSFQDAMLVFDGLMASGDLYKVMDETGQALFKLFGVWYNFIGYLEPGQGYYVKVNNACNLDINCTGQGPLPKESVVAVNSAQPEHFAVDVSGNPYQPMNIFVVEAAFDDLNLAAGDEIAVYDGDQCVGVAALANEVSHESPLQIVAVGDDGSGVGFKEGDALTFKIWKRATQEELPIIAEHVQYLDPVNGNEAEPVAFQGLGSAVVAIDAETVVPEQALPTSYSLEQNFPNPFNPSTKISYGLPRETDLSLKIFDVRGNLVKTLHSGKQAAGFHTIEWDGTNSAGQKVASGIYLYKLSCSEFTQTNKMIFTK